MLDFTFSHGYLFYLSQISFLSLTEGTECTDFFTCCASVFLDRRTEEHFFLLDICLALLSFFSLPQMAQISLIFFFFIFDSLFFSSDKKDALRMPRIFTRFASVFRSRISFFYLSRIFFLPLTDIFFPHTESTEGTDFYLLRKCFFRQKNIFSS